MVIVAGERYGTGSSRDWAAKGQRLLGIRAVLARSFERIHRTNLVGMGILPLSLPAEVRAGLGEIAPTDRFEVDVDAEALVARAVVRVRRVAAIGRVDHLGLRAALETTTEVGLLRAGGAIPLILRRVLADAH